MPEDPPRAPDWSPGPDGYWPPAPPPPGAWGPPQGWGVPPRPPRSKAPLVIGLVTVAAVVLAVMIVGAVTVTQRVNGGGQSFDEAVADSGGRTGTRSEGSSDKGAKALGDGWKLETAQPEPISTPDCAPEGWMDGATDQYRTDYEKRGFQHTEATVVVTTFATEDLRENAVDLAHTEKYRECVRLDALPLSTGDVVVEELPADPRTPGVAFQTTDEAGAHVWRFVIGVGTQRSTVTFCGCDTGFDVRRDVAHDVAAAMAEAQGLPSPG